MSTSILFPKFIRYIYNNVKDLVRISGDNLHTENGTADYSWSDLQIAYHYFNEIKEAIENGNIDLAYEYAKGIREFNHKQSEIHCRESELARTKQKRF